jgi:hypothetical protein
MAFTYKITGASTFVLDPKEGFVWISISVSTDSTSVATILGTTPLNNGTESIASDILIGQSVILDKKGAYPIAFTLTVPSGCIVNIIAN